MTQPEKNETRKIRLVSSGGFANLTFRGEVEEGSLPEELREELVRLAAAGAFEGPKAVMRGAADSMQMTLVLPGPEGEPKTYRFDELAVEPEVLDAVDSLKAEMLRQRRAASREDESR